jgi:hypothetical protein
MAFKFENLRIWQLSLELADDIDLLAQTFPKHRYIFCLVKLEERQIQFL